LHEVLLATSHIRKLWKAKIEIVCCYLCTIDDSCHYLWSTARDDKLDSSPTAVRFCQESFGRGGRLEGWCKILHCSRCGDVAVLGIQVLSRLRTVKMKKGEAIVEDEEGGDVFQQDVLATFPEDDART